MNANIRTPFLMIWTAVDGMVARHLGRLVNVATSGTKSRQPILALGVLIGVRIGHARLHRRVVVSAQLSVSPTMP